MRVLARALPPAVVLVLVVGVAAPASAATGTAWDYFPGPLPLNGSGTAVTRDFTAVGWLASNATTLSGPYAHAYLDLTDDNTPSAGDEIPPSSGSSWSYPFSHVNDGSPFHNCSANFPCSWDSFTANSWQTNAKQSATQAFYFVNRFHDYLAGPPFDFTAARGNFEGSDAVQVEVLDGASTDSGFPDNDHFNAYRMTTPPDGAPPRMELRLLSSYGPNGGDVDSADDASIVYQLYAEGMADRLVTDADGSTALDGAQGQAMREGWGDWYAMDFLVNHGYDADNAEVGDVNPEYYAAGGLGARTQPLDCPVSVADDPCVNFNGAGDGGYSYDDFGRVLGQPIAVADGEIWSQTLWELRQRLIAKYGVAAGDLRAETYVTRAMELTTTANPSFVDLRNAILQAETNATAPGQPFAGSDDNDVLWQTFANRGMGFFAASVDGSDLDPVADFSQPPASGAPKGTLSGTVTLFDGGAPAAGVQVSLVGHPDLLATTATDGTYTIPNIPQGTYPYVFASSPGYDRTETGSVAIAGPTTRNLQIRRNWAQRDGGASVDAFSPPDLSSVGCGPGGAIDGTLAEGWGSTSPSSSQGPGGAKSLTIKLPRSVDLSTFAVDPGATCGDDDNASLGAYKIETSPDGSAYTQANAGTFTASNNHRLNTLVPAVGTTQAVRYVRVTMMSPQSGSGDGADWMDLSEVKVYGVAHPVVAVTGLTATGGPGQVSLQWSSVSGASGYEVFRRTSGGNYPMTPTATPSGTSYTDTGLASATTYCYEVAAAGGPHSAEACATTTTSTSPPPPPPPPPPPGTSISLAAIPKTIPVNRKGQFVVRLVGPASASGEITVTGKGLGRLVHVRFTTGADGTTRLKLKLSIKKFEKLDDAGRTKATITVVMGAASAAKKVKLDPP